jgi:tetrahydromethanopterin S-methyltransferase subunit G
MDIQIAHSGHGIIAKGMLEIAMGEIEPVDYYDIHSRVGRLEERVDNIVKARMEDKARYEKVISDSEESWRKIHERINNISHSLSELRHEVLESIESMKKIDISKILDLFLKIAVPIMVGYIMLKLKV